MKFDINQEVLKKTVQHKRRQRWQKRLSAMAAVVVFCTTYALILPAITMEKSACEIPEHTHSEECYVPFVEESWQELKVCAVPEADVIIHTHDENCYDRSGHLLCTLEERQLHTHTAECYVVREEEVQEEVKEEAEEPKPEKSEREKLKEDVKDVIISVKDEVDKLLDDFIRDDGTAEETTFDTPEQERTHEQAEKVVDAFVDAFFSKVSATESADTPQCGMEELELHTHDETCLNESGEVICGKLQVVEHTHDASCMQTIYSVPDLVKTECGMEEATEGTEGHTHEDACFTYWMTTCGLQEHIHNVDCGVPYQADLELENDAMLLKLQVFDPEPLPEDLSFELITMTFEDSEYIDYADYAVEEMPGELRALSAYRIAFFSGGQEIDLPNAEIMAEMTVKELELPDAQEATPAGMQTFALGEPAVLASSADGSGESGETEEEEDPSAYQMHLTALNTTSGGVTDADSATVELSEPETPTMYMSLGSSRTFALARSVEPLPMFEIHYLCNMLRYYTPSDTSRVLQVINTARTDGSYPVEGEPLGGILPQNGNGSSASPNSNSIYNLYLEPSSTHDGYYRTAMNYELVEVYQTQKNVIYSNSMTSKHMDVLRDNDHYGVTHIQTQAAGETDWTSYKVNDQSHINDTGYHWNGVDELYYFTNNPAAVTDDQNRDPIVISDGMKVRYIYFPTSKNISFDASFFDYDISDGSHTTKSGVTTMDTGKQGINVAANYTNGNGSGSAELAFGNSNTGSGRQNETISDSGGTHYINQYNTNSYRGLTFGIVTAFNPTTGKLTYNSGITAPYLFDFTPSGTTVNGKTSYANTDMVFRRDGDTYTLTKVEGSDGIEDTNLELFEITYTYTDGRNLYSNSFWPFDGINDGKDGHDIHFGSATAYANGTEKFNGLNADGTAATGKLPPGDEGAEHNSYFGLEYAVDFHLDGSYTGPLEYLFYGDDDMWVFLTDRTDPENVTTELIADIGGVHSSVGSYTDLWDWVPNTEERPNGKGDYTLTFFYTERGASGSSCYMQFTIPDAVGVPQQSSEVGSVEVEKIVAGSMTTDEDFTFDYTITYPAGLAEVEKDRILPYTIYDASGKVISGALFREGSFELKAGQKIIIGNIPVGSEFAVSEQVTAEGNFNAQWTTVPAGATHNGDTVAGTITTGGQTIAFDCTNTYNSLTLEKKIDTEPGFTVADAFTFEVLLTDASSVPLTDNVNVLLRAADGTYAAPVDTALTNGKLTVALKVNESVSIYPLPDGTKYTITETDSGGLLPTWPDGSGGELYTADTSGAIASGNVFVTCTNRAYYQMPSTGGMGTTLYTMGGLLMMTASGFLGYKKKRKEDEPS